MKKALALLVVVGLSLIFLTPTTKPNRQVSISQTPSSPTEKTAPQVHLLSGKESVFVPDWNLTEETILHNGYDRWIYFGTAGKLDLFREALPDKNLWLTIKVDDADGLEKVSLGDYNLARISGIVLDLEINGLATDKLKARINDGVRKIYGKAKERDLLVALALYGDLFYRKRPYDLKILNGYSDEIMIMAYDYHKSYGEPGENYPYLEFKKMIDNYLEYVPADKLTVVYGMYGYDWTMNGDKPLKPGEPVTLAQVKERFLGRRCLEDECKITANDESMEKKVTYVDEEGRDHIVYFEDEESADKKSEFLLGKGIRSISFWAWGYF